MSELITCPSGLTGRVRNMKVREERILADRKLAKSGGLIDELLASCWEETKDAGPYTFDEGKTNWGRVLQGDRFHALLQVRCLTYGPTYAFSATCTEEGCRHRIHWELNLNDLPVRPLSPESRERFLAGNRFPATLPISKKKVWFKLLTGDDERKLVALRKASGDRALSALLAHRVVEIEGIEAKDQKALLEELSMGDADFLHTEFDRVDCGVETHIDIECPECFATQAIELPFDKAFFLPSARKTPSQASAPSSLT